MQKKIKFIPDFDSSSSMLFSLGNFLSDSEEGVGLPSRLPKMIGDLINSTPEGLRESIYELSGMNDSLELDKLKKINDEYISQWIIDSYPEKKYPAIVIGSSNGGLIHMCAALGIPWIPQTVLLPVSRKMDPDKLIEDALWGKEAADIIRRKIPYMGIYQMHDPIQDRIMVANMGYFRIKRLALGKTLEAYIEKALVPGGIIFISDCRFKWSSAEMGENHYFQTGGLGDVSSKEYAEGSARIKEFLQKEKSKQERWDLPGPLTDRPEAEWGYDERLTEDILKYAKKKNYKIKRMSFETPKDLSPLAAELSRYWYEKNGITDKRLLVECFAMIEPWWAVKTGSIPFWMPFNTASSYESLQTYLKGCERFDEIYLMIMSNAVEGIGCMSIDDWKKIIGKAKNKGSLIGIDEDKFPFDLGSFIKYHKDLQKKITARYFMPDRLSINEFISFVAQNDAYNLKIEDVL